VLPFSIDWREVAITAFVFLLVLIGFGLLAAVIHWPNEHDGWPLAVAVAAIIAFMPIIARTFSFLQQSRASFEGPFGIKINFSAAAQVATISTTKLTENLIEPGVSISASSTKELNAAAVKATQHSVVVIDLGDGRAWYKTRLFALAATAEFLHAPKALILLGQRGRQARCVAGWIRPDDVVKGLIRSEPAYAELWRHVQGYMCRLQSKSDDAAAQFPMLGAYQSAFAEAGPAAVMYILLNQMRNPDAALAPTTPPATPLEDPQAPIWITMLDVEFIFDAWLVRETLDLGKPQQEQLTTLLAAKSELVVATRGDEYAGVIDVVRVQRELLRQMVTPSASGSGRTTGGDVGAVV
jgi:hypothetical protein